MIVLVIVVPVVIAVVKVTTIAVEGTPWTSNTHPEFSGFL